MLNRRLFAALLPLVCTAALAAEPTPIGAEVRKVDREKFKLTLKHDEIPYLNMPGMTMVFEVQDAADRVLLSTLRPGQKLRFIAVRVDGVFVARALTLVP